MIQYNLFLFAHQDDEFGVFAEIERLIKSRETVKVIYLTSGYAMKVKENIRNLESLDVLNKLGLDKVNISFLGAENDIFDGKLINQVEYAYKLLQQYIVKNGNPKRIYCHAWEGGHQDHDAVYVLGTVLADEIKIIENSFQFTLYMGKGLPSAFFKLFSPLPENGEETSFVIPILNRIRYLKYCFMYPTQMKTWVGLFPFLFIYYLINGHQILQPLNIKRLNSKPHQGKLLYERRGFYEYPTFQMLLEKFMQKYVSDKLT